MVKYRKKEIKKALPVKKTVKKVKADEIELIKKAIGKTVERKNPDKTILHTLAQKATAPIATAIKENVAIEPTIVQTEVETETEEKASEGKEKVDISPSVEVENMSSTEIDEAVNTLPTSAPSTAPVAAQSTQATQSVTPTLKTTNPTIILQKVTPAPQTFYRNILQTPVSQTVPVKLKGGKLSQGEAEQEIVNILQKLPNTALRRQELRDMIKKALKPNTSIMTKGGAKTTGKPQWEANTNWAISNLSKQGVIAHVGRNAYGLTGKAYVPPSPKTFMKKYQKAKAQAQPNVTIKNVTVAPSATAQPVQGVKPKLDEPLVLPPKPIPETTVSKPEDNQHIKIIEPMPESFILKNAPANYIPEEKLVRHFKVMAKQDNIPPLLLSGPPGVAKTASVRDFAYKNKLPLVAFHGSPMAGEAELIGSTTLKTDANGQPEARYVLGALPTALTLANKNGIAVLLLDEVNVLSQRNQKILNSFDQNMSISIPELSSKAYSLNPGCKLIVVGTMNPSFSGTAPLNPELKGRFIEMRMDYPTPAKEERILFDSRIWGNRKPDAEVVSRLIAVAKETRNYANKPEARDFYPISPRDLTLTLYTYVGYLNEGIGDKDALSTAIEAGIVNKYENPTYMAEVIRWIKSNLKDRVSL